MQLRTSAPVVGGWDGDMVMGILRRDKTSLVCIPAFHWSGRLSLGPGSRQELSAHFYEAVLATG